MSINAVLNSLEEVGRIGPRRLIELGKIKIGGLGETRQGQNGTWRLPVKDDHFSIVTNERDTNGDLIESHELMESLLEKYADDDGKLRAFPIRLLSNDIEEVVQSEFVWYGGQTCFARSDGKTVTWFNSKQNGQRLPAPVTEPWSNNLLKMTVQKKPMFVVSTTLQCVIADQAARWGGVYKFRTKSVISTQNLDSSLVYLQRLTGGILEGMPLWLVVRPLKVTPDGKPSTVYVVHIELRGPDIKQLQHEAREQARYQIEFKRDMSKYDRQFKTLLLDPAADIDGEPDGDDHAPPPPDKPTPDAPEFGYGIDVPPNPDDPPAAAPDADVAAQGDDAGQGELEGRSPEWPGWVQTYLNRIAAAIRMSLLEPIGDELLKEYRDEKTAVPDRVQCFPALFSEWTMAVAKLMGRADKPRLLSKIGGWGQYLPAALHQSMMKVLS